MKRRGLWAAHLEPELGGGGFGQVKLGLMHEILGQTARAPSIFGNNAPDSGNAELIAVGGTAEQKKKWMEPLLAGEMRSAFSMTEPEVAGSDPKLIRTRARRDGDEWVIDGHKWFTSNGSRADFLITMAVTDPESHPFKGSSMFIVPTKSPGLKIVRDVPTMSEPDHKTGDPGGHSEVIYDNCRIPFENVVGGEAGIGQGFVLAQKRLGPGRIHHAMRWLGISKRAFDMLCERAVSRYSHGSLLSEKQMVQDWVATSHAEMQAARLLTLHAAWKMDKVGASQRAQRDRGHQVLRRERALQRDRPRHPGARRARLLDRHAARAHVPRRALGAAGRRRRRGAQGDARAHASSRVRAGRGADRAPADAAQAAREKFAEYLDTMAVNA